MECLRGTKADNCYLHNCNLFLPEDLHAKAMNNLTKSMNKPRNNLAVHL